MVVQAVFLDIDGTLVDCTSFTFVHGNKPF
jgi:FMN phosphatase YigB (HAD superfamily)